MRVSLGVVLALSLLLLGSVAVEATDGAALYKSNCASCHGADGKGETKMGKKLGVSPLSAKTADALVEFIKSNEKHEKVAAKVSADEIKAIAGAMPSGS